MAQLRTKDLVLGAWRLVDSCKSIGVTPIQKPVLRSRSRKLELIMLLQTTKR